MICRIASLDGFNGVLLGRDLFDVFENGHVYNVQKVAGQIIITDLGKHAQPEHLTNKEGKPIGLINQYAVCGTTLLTVEEYEAEKEKEEN